MKIIKGRIKRMHKNKNMYLSRGYVAEVLIETGWWIFKKQTWVGLSFANNLYEIGSYGYRKYCIDSPRDTCIKLMNGRGINEDEIEFIE
jgi:hypothetical protein